MSTTIDVFDVLLLRIDQSSLDLDDGELTSGFSIGVIGDAVADSGSKRDNPNCESGLYICVAGGPD